jgi:hypothetical protein
MSCASWELVERGSTFLSYKQETMEQKGGDARSALVSAAAIGPPNISLVSANIWEGVDPGDGRLWSSSIYIQALKSH